MWSGAADRVLEPPDWDLPSNWKPTGVLQAGEDVVIASGGPRIKSDHPSLCDLKITLGRTNAADPALIAPIAPKSSTRLST
jgi:hypothetical protein